MPTIDEMEFFHKHAYKSSKALSYYYSRGINKSLISEFKLGYCPYSIDHWAKGRIVIPIFDAYGRFLDFGTRLITEPGQPGKWMNGTFNNTSIGKTEKGHHLFNLNKAKPHILDARFAIITEGYFDVITAWKYGIKNIVATCGTAFTFTHMCLLSRYCDLFVIAYDGDASGVAAAIKAEAVFDSYIGIVRLELPEGYDLDEFLRKHGAEEFYNLMRAENVV